MTTGGGEAGLFWPHFLCLTGKSRPSLADAARHWQMPPVTGRCRPLLADVAQCLPFALAQHGAAGSLEILRGEFGAAGVRGVVGEEVRPVRPMAAHALEEVLEALHAHLRLHQALEAIGVGLLFLAARVLQ